MNEEKRMYDLTNRMLKMANGEHPTLIIGCAFNVINNICAEFPELRPNTADFMQKLIPIYEASAQEVTEH